jgi:hypothetical protein
VTRWLFLLMLCGCGEASREQATTPGAALEAAAVAEGLVADPARASLVGSWGRDSDRVCVVGPDRGEQRIGAVVDYGDGIGCSAGGTVRRDGDRLKVVLGEDCRFDARFDGERIIFPAEVPEACEARCTGRASLAALTVERLSESASEATTLRGRRGEMLCSG